MIDIKGNSERLKALRGARKTSDAAAFVHEMLASKFEGLQSVAIQILSSWGQKDDKTAIRNFLLHTYKKRPGWGGPIRLTAISALEHFIAADDATWLPDLCFSQNQMANRHELFRLFSKLTPDATRSYLQGKFDSADSLDRWAAARAVMAIRFPDQKKLLTPLLTDSDRSVRDTAANGIAQG